MFAVADLERAKAKIEADNAERRSDAEKAAKGVDGKTGDGGPGVGQ